MGTLNDFRKIGKKGQSPQPVDFDDPAVHGQLLHAARVQMAMMYPFQPITPTELSRLTPNGAETFQLHGLTKLDFFVAHLAGEMMRGQGPGIVFNQDHVVSMVETVVRTADIICRSLAKIDHDETVKMMERIKQQYSTAHADENSHA